MIKALTFDLDDTLWAVGPVIHEANLRLLKWMETHAPRFVEQYGLPGFNSLRDEVLVQQPEIGHDMTKLRLALLELGLARCDYDNYQELAKAGFEIYFAARNDVEFFPHALQQLAQLKQNYTLGALTNGNAELPLVGLDHLFDFGFNAADVGIAKPAPDMFQQALSHMQLDPHAVIHIGDNPEADVFGAQNLGMHTIWVNLDDQSWPQHLAPATAEINHLSELTQAVQRIHKQLESQ
jgi:putative hydrolase of the HAD superfamily